MICLAGGIRGAPVGHDKTTEAPFAAEHIRQQFLAVGRMRAVHQVVAGHQGFGSGLFHGKLKTLQIDFPQGPLGAVGVGVGAVILLIVEGKVLDGGAAAGMALHALGIRGGTKT